MKNVYGLGIYQTTNNVIYEELRNFEKKISMEIDLKSNQKGNKKEVKKIFNIFYIKIFLNKAGFFKNKFKKGKHKTYCFKPSFRFLIF